MVGFVVVFIVCFIIQLFIWHSFISNQLKKHHIRKSDIKKLISNLCSGNYNKFSHYCRHISTGGSLLLVIATLIIFPLVMTVVIDAAIETHSWLILIVFFHCWIWWYKYCYSQTIRSTYRIVHGISTSKETVNKM